MTVRIVPKVVDLESIPTTYYVASWERSLGPGYRSDPSTVELDKCQVDQVLTMWAGNIHWQAEIYHP